MEAFYLGQRPHRLFTVLHIPSNPVDTGLVFCPPLWGEMTGTYSRLAVWAKELAQQGFAVLRFDLYGTGESDGKLRELTLQGAYEDTVRVSQYLRKRCGIKRLGLFGMRFGGTMAVHAANTIQPDFLLLWSPVVNLHTYARNFLRMRLTTQIVHHQSGQAGVTSQQMARELEDGRSVDVLGWEVPSELYREMNAHRSFPDQVAAREVLWLDRAVRRSEALPILNSWKECGCEAAGNFLPLPKFWVLGSLSSIRHLADASGSWLARRLLPSEASCQLTS